MTKVCHCKFGYCDATAGSPCFCSCHREGERGCWTCECNKQKKTKSTWVEDIRDAFNKNINKKIKVE